MALQPGSAYLCKTIDTLYVNYKKEGKMLVDHNPWTLYDVLIDGIPEDIHVLDYGLGLHWTYVTAECGCGVAWTMKGGYTCKSVTRKDKRDMTLKEMAKLAKSWRFEDATLGVAAMNAWYSRREMLDPLGAVYEEPRKLERTERKRESFSEFKPLMEGKKVSVIGHFPHVYDLVDSCEKLTVLERIPSGEDLPDSACEYVLPEQDMTFITGTTTINKTLPRLLTLTEPGLTILTGPSVVMSAKLFDFGADVLAGSTVNDPELTAFCCRNGNGQLFGEAIQMMRIIKPGLTLDLAD